MTGFFTAEGAEHAEEKRKKMWNDGRFLPRGCGVRGEGKNKELFFGFRIIEK